MFLSVIAKNSNWEILTNNLVTFKKLDGVKDEKLQFLGVHWKIQLLGGKFTKNQHTGGIGGLPRKGGLDSLQI